MFKDIQITETTGNSINVIFLKFIIPVAGCHCDYWPQAPINLAMPLKMGYNGNAYNSETFARNHKKQFYSKQWNKPYSTALLI
jgi:hypothetical protein